MNYIYDLYLCFSLEYMDSFEWRREDFFQIVEQIPIKRISDIQMSDIFSNIVKIDSSFLDSIYNKTITSDGCIPYALLVTDLNRVVALEFDSSGLVIRWSSLLLDEEEVVMEEALNYSLELIPFKKLKKINCTYFLTRKEKEIQKFLISNLDYLYKNKKMDEVDYLYQELFKKDLPFAEKYHILRDSIINDFNNNHKRLYDILLLTQ